MDILYIFFQNFNTLGKKFQISRGAAKRVSNQNFAKILGFFTKKRQNDVRISSYIVKNYFLRFFGNFTICVNISAQLKYFWRFWFFWFILIDLCWFDVNFHFKMVIKSWKLFNWADILTQIVKWPKKFKNYFLTI